MFLYPYASTQRCSLTHRVRPSPGLAIWTGAAFCCGLSPAYPWLVVCRMIVGIGEASFVALAAPFIDDNAPAAKKTRWLALFYLTIPVGVASGYIVGGLMGTHAGWRAPFILEAALMLPFLALTLGSARPVDLRLSSAPPPHRCSDLGAEPGSLKDEEGGRERQRLLTAPGDMHLSESVDSLSSRPNAAPPSDRAGLDDPDTPSHAGARPRMPVPRGPVELPPWAARRLGPSVAPPLAAFLGDVRTVFLHRVFVYNLAAGCCWCAVVGGYSFFGPRAGKEVFGLAKEKADSVFGAVTVVTGILGTALGGIALDRIGSTMSNALLLCAASVATGMVLILFAFTVCSSFGGFIFFLALGELGLFAAQAPSNLVALASVPADLRPFSMSCTTVFVHLLGDVPSPPIIGAVFEANGSWRATMGMATCWLGLGVLFYVVGRRECGAAQDYRPEMQGLGSGAGPDSAPGLGLGASSGNHGRGGSEAAAVGLLGPGPPQAAYDHL